MSLLIFMHQERHALVLTDCLATTPTGEAFVFQSKAWAIPHMNKAVAITGIAAPRAATLARICRPRHDT